MSGFDVGPKHVGDGAPCLIVAEVGQAHEGSLGMAHAYIDAIANAGTDAVKFQCHIAEAESWPEEPWRVEPRWPQDWSRYEYWRRMEFNPDQWAGLKQHADERGLIFLCSPFSVEAVKMLDPLVSAWKVASGEVTNSLLLAHMTKRGNAKPLLISTGMSRMEELRLANMFATAGCAFLQCTSEYPCPPEHVGLNQVRRLRAYFSDCPIGLSDHSGTIFPGLAAVALGCDVLEVHVTLSREAFGFDVSSSITTAELRQLVEGVRFIEKAKTPLDKDAMARELQPMRELFMDKHKRRAANA